MRRVLIISYLSAVISFVQAVSPAAYAVGRQRPTTGNQEFELGRQAYDRQDYANAIKHFYAADKTLDTDATLHYYLANALSFAGHDEESRREYLKCNELEPGSHVASLARDALFGRGQNVFAFSQSSPFQRSVIYRPQMNAISPSLSANYSSQSTGKYITPSYVSSSAAYRPLFNFAHPPSSGYMPNYSGSSANISIPSFQPNIPSQTVASTPDGQSVRQFIQDLNGQLSDRKRLAMSESYYNPYRTIDVAPFQPIYTPSRRYHRGWGDPYSYPRSNYSPRYFGSRQQFGYTFEQRSLAFEQAAAGLESQLLNNNAGVKFNPKGSNLYIRNYGSGIVPVWQPEPVVELLAKQERLVIDEPAPQHKGSPKASGAKNDAQETP